MSLRNFFEISVIVHVFLKKLQTNIKSNFDSAKILKELLENIGVMVEKYFENLENGFLLELK